MEDEAIRLLVVRLARPRPSGGHVIARAAILAEGADFTAVVDWITAHGGVPEDAVAATRSGGGLHGVQVTGTRAPKDAPARRFVLPPGALEPSRAERYCDRRGPDPVTVSRTYRRSDGCGVCWGGVPGWRWPSSSAW